VSRVRKRVTGVQYFLEHHQGYLYILTNDPTDAVKLADDGGYYLARCMAERSMLNKWEVILYGLLLLMVKGFVVVVVVDTDGVINKIK
jgi:hypothetical protein